MESGAGIIVLGSKRSLSNILTKHKHLKNIKEKAGKTPLTNVNIYPFQESCAILPLNIDFVSVTVLFKVKEN